MTETARNPTVSVVLPTYNRAHILGKAIQTVLNQTYQDLELIIVDDGSTDNTADVVRGFADKRVKYIRLNQNSGSCAAPRNAGIKIARGEYIALQDDDCDWLPEKLEKQIEAFGRAPTRVGVVYTGLWRILDNGKTYFPPPSVSKKEGDIHREVLTACYIGNPPVLIKKECFKKAGMFDEKLPAAVEWDMWIRVSKFYDFRFIDEPLVTTHYSSATTHYDEISWIRALLLLSNKHFQEIAQVDKRLLAERYFNCGAFLCINRDRTQFAEGRRALQEAARICPPHLKYTFFSFLSLTGPTLFHNDLLRRLYRWFNRKS